jgi:hypothetical protein
MSNNFRFSSENEPNEQIRDYGLSPFCRRAIGRAVLGNAEDERRRDSQVEGSGARATSERNPRDAVAPINKGKSRFFIRRLRVAPRGVWIAVFRLIGVFEIVLAAPRS